LRDIALKNIYCNRD